ncbi:MFS transporter [Actinocrispum sp. NPDC049592]|uniref:MFS transporter n=1 Tax=Actinocrispum sp. NPDC049592 TaxID=3154835 RepID=UPI003428942F
MNSQRSPWLVFTALVTGQVATLLDTTVVNVAVPTLSRSLDASLDSLLWVINGYVLAYAVLLVIGGRLGDLYGYRKIFMAGVVVFTVASVLCGSAQNVDQLIAMRVLQGAGAAMLTPQVLSLMVLVFPDGKGKRSRAAAFAMYMTVGGVGGALGPTVGGLLVDSLGWRWIFFLNVPIGVATLLFASAWLPKAVETTKQRLDLLGTIVVTAGLFLITYGLIEGERHAWGKVWGPVTIPMLIGAGILVLGLFALIERGRQGRDPLLPFVILKSRNFTIMALVVTTLPMAFGALLFLTLLQLQSVMGINARDAGLVLAINAVVMAFVSPFSARLVDRFGPKLVLISAFGIYSVGLFAMAAEISGDAQWWQLLPGVMITGAAAGLTGAPIGVLAMRDIQPEVTGAASGVYNTTRLSGSLVGSAAVGALLQSQLTAHSVDPDLMKHGLVPAEFRAGFADAIQITFLLPAAALLAGGLLAMAARKPTTKPEQSVPAEDEPAIELSTAAKN